MHYLDYLSAGVPIVAMKLPGFQNRVLLGGGFWQCPEGAFGVNMAKELRSSKCSINLGVEDHGAPDFIQAEEAVREVLKVLVFNEQDVFVGCMGGQGRTGTFLALLANCLRSPGRNVVDWYWGVDYVRTKYRVGAVESRHQMAFLKDFPYHYLNLVSLRAVRAAWVWDRVSPWAPEWLKHLTKRGILLYLS